MKRVALLTAPASAKQLANGGNRNVMAMARYATILDLLVAMA